MKSLTTDKQMIFISKKEKRSQMLAALTWMNAIPEEFAHLARMTDIITTFGDMHMMTSAMTQITVSSYCLYFK